MVKPRAKSALILVGRGIKQSHKEWSPSGVTGGDPRAFSPNTNVCLSHQRCPDTSSERCDILPYGVVVSKYDGPYRDDRTGEGEKE